MKSRKRVVGTIHARRTEQEEGRKGGREEGRKGGREEGCAPRGGVWRASGVKCFGHGDIWIFDYWIFDF